MTQEELKEIRERVDAATPGPWTADVNDQDDCVVWRNVDVEQNDGIFVFNVGWGKAACSDIDPKDAQFIAHARQDVPRLLDHIEYLEDLVLELRCDIDRC